MRNLKPRAVKPRIGLRSPRLYLASARPESPSWDCNSKAFSMTLVWSTAVCMKKMRKLRVMGRWWSFTWAKCRGRNRAAGRCFLEPWLLFPLWSPLRAGCSILCSHIRDGQVVTAGHLPWNECSDLPFLYQSDVSRHILSFSGLHFGPFMFFWEPFLFPSASPPTPTPCLSTPSFSGWQAEAVLIPSSLGARHLTCATSWSDSSPSTTFLFPVKLCKQSTNTKLLMVF